MSLKYFFLWIIRRLLLALRADKYFNTPQSKHKFLQGNFKSLTHETKVTFLKPEGQMPKIIGRYLRNGPNPKFRSSTYHFPFDGDGMLHRIEFKEREIFYQNSWVKTHGLQAEIKAKHSLYSSLFSLKRPGFVNLCGHWLGFVPIKNTASVGVLQLDREAVALSEAQRAYSVSENLKTNGFWVPKGRWFPPKVNAHYRQVDNKNYMFSYDSLIPELIFYEISLSGNLIKEQRLYKDRISMIHDFALTKNYKVLFDSPALFNGCGKGDFIEWKPEQSTFIILINKKGSLQKFKITNCFVFHIANAYEKQSQIIVDAVTYSKFWSLDHKAKNIPAGKLQRYVINLDNKTVIEESLLTHVEFPVTFKGDHGKEYSKLYLLQQRNSQTWFDQIVCYDLKKKKSDKTNLENYEFSEVFLVKGKDLFNQSKDYLLTIATKKGRSCSEVLVFNALDLRFGIIAKVNLPCKVPHGLHGSWRPRF